MDKAKHLLSEIVLVVVFCTVWFSNLAMGAYNEWTIYASPRRPIASSGQIVPMPNHGHSYYVTDWQQRLRGDSMVVCIMVIALLVYFSRQKKPAYGAASRAGRAATSVAAIVFVFMSAALYLFGVHIVQFVFTGVWELPSPVE